MREPTAERLRGAARDARRGVCRICAAGAAPGYSMCTSCRDVAVALGRPPLPVTPIALVNGSSPLYRALRQYKSGERDVASRQAARLGSLLDRFLTRHAACIAPDGLDLCVVVPSPCDGRPPPHPLAALVARSRVVPPPVDALFPGPARVAHRQPATSGYHASDGVRGKRVLLLDDVYTSGAHLQSAATALGAGGAKAVYALVLARFVRKSGPRLRCARCEH